MRPSKKNKLNKPSSTFEASTVYIKFSVLSIIFLSSIAFIINFYHSHYLGNNYFPPDTTSIAIILIIMYCGCSIQFGSTNQLSKTMKEIIIFFIMISILAILTNAVQYTPFSPIDYQIYSIEQSLHINLQGIIAWTNHYPQLKQGLDFIYNTLPLQMTFIPLFIIFANQRQKIREFYFLMLCSAMIGFIFYYFFPTTGPASIVKSPFFSEAQKATTLKFIQLHQQIKPSTLEGGLIALPSFHVIWAWLCLYLLRDWPMVYFPMGILNLILMASCVLLGWHYPIDIIGSVLVVCIAHSLYFILIIKKGDPSSQAPRDNRRVVNNPITKPVSIYYFC